MNTASAAWPIYLQTDFAAAAVRLTTIMSPAGQYLIFGCVELFPHEIPVPPSAISPRKKQIGDFTLVSGITVMPVSDALAWYECALDDRLYVPGIPHTVTVTTLELAPEPAIGRLVIGTELPFEARWHCGPRLHHLLPLGDAPESLQWLGPTSKTAARPKAREWIAEALGFDLLLTRIVSLGSTLRCSTSSGWYDRQQQTALSTHFVWLGTRRLRPPVSNENEKAIREIVATTVGVEMTSFLPEDMPVPPRLKFHKKFQPCSVEEGEEMYPNGIFVFNITRLLAFIKANPEQYPVELVPLEEFPCYDDGSRLNPETVRTADLSRPIVLAEISPGFYNVIDGNHRLGKARQDGVRTIPAYRVRCPQHVPFLTSMKAYEKYVEYWNSKVKTLQESARTRARRQTSEPKQA